MRETHTTMGLQSIKRSSTMKKVRQVWLSDTVQAGHRCYCYCSQRVDICHPHQKSFGVLRTYHTSYRIVCQRVRGKLLDSRRGKKKNQKAQSIPLIPVSLCLCLSVPPLVPDTDPHTPTYILIYTPTVI